MENNTQQEVKDEFLKVFTEFDINSFYPFPIGANGNLSSHLEVAYNSCRSFHSLISSGLFEIVFKNKDLELTSIELGKELIDMMKKKLSYIKTRIYLEEPSLAAPYREGLRIMLMVALTQILVEAINLQKNELSKQNG